MNFPLYISRRYLFAKKSHHAINLISGISAGGVAIATAAMVCILSVFNGFQEMVAGLFTAFDPQLEVIPTEGKYMVADEPELEKLKQQSTIEIYTESLEDNALLTVNNRQVMCTIKGVDDNFKDLIDFRRIQFGQGTFNLHADVIQYGIIGINLLQALNISVDFSNPVMVFAPRKGEHIDLNDPQSSFNQEELYSPRVSFEVHQNKYDSKYVITSIGFARRLFERQGYVTSIELKLHDDVDTQSEKSRLQSLLGPKYKVLDRYEQQEETFKIMKIEKLISYIFLTFILLVASFNIISSLSMLIIDKRNDIQTLSNLGADRSIISRIFLNEGILISAMGAFAGIIIGLSLCLIQQNYGIIKFGRSAGNYIIDTYPVSVHAADIVIIFATVLVISLISAWIPTRKVR